MKKLLTLALALVALAAFTGLGVSTASTSASAASVSQLKDCRFAGQTLPAVDLSTTTSTGTDPHWTVTGPTQSSGTPAVGGPIYATLTGWPAISGYWIQPFATGTTDPYGTVWPNAAEGDYTYKVQFHIPCDPKNYASLSIGGAISGDNNFKASLNGSFNTIASCTNGLCFKSSEPITTAPGMFLPGLNTITVVVDNDGGYTGLAVKASLSARCGKECCKKLPQRGRGDMQDDRMPQEE